MASRLKILGITLAATLAAAATDPMSVTLPGITVAARRPADIGRVESRLDSAALRESVALSLSDVLGFNSSIFLKNYGRATTSTANFRGTSPSHTQVSWNGMRISSPMLGSTDFSLIPSYFVDKVSILHGSSSLSDTGGGLGGLVKLTSDAASTMIHDGLSARYVQGIGSWKTFDEYFQIGYARGQWRASARVSYSSSENDFPFTNTDKKENIYDDNHNIVSSYHPRQRNRSGAFKDFHAMLSASYDARRLGRWSIDAWYLSSNRELPILTTDYTDNRFTENRQREETLRAVATWSRPASRNRLTAKGGYAHSWQAYDYRRDLAPGVVSVMNRSRSHVNTAFGSVAWAWYPATTWLFNADADVHYNHVTSLDYASSIPGGPPTGYDRGRVEASVAVSGKWRPSSRLGLGALVREEVYGSKVSAPIPAIFADYTIVPSIGLVAKASASRNYRFPTLNDLYTVPGGNADLKPERGFTYDLSLSSEFSYNDRLEFSATAGWYDSRIDDWIHWLPSPRGFYVPSNVKRVHAYGIESQVAGSLKLNSAWTVRLSASYTWSASINDGEPMSDADRSVGKQLPYIPRHSFSAIASVMWHGWSLAYKIQAYSERFTMSSNERVLGSTLPPYSVSNLSLDKSFPLWRLQWHAKAAVNNLFDTTYRTVLSRPMPGINFELFLSLEI